MYACMYVCMYVCMHACMYVDVCIHIYIYIHTYVLRQLAQDKGGPMKRGFLNSRLFSYTDLCV